LTTSFIGFKIQNKENSKAKYDKYVLDKGKPENAEKLRKKAARMQSFCPRTLSTTWGKFTNP